MTAQDQPQRFCIFCHQPATSREHLLPDWLREVLPAQDKVLHTRQVDAGEEQKWTKKPFEEKTKQVCCGCNHGWMSRLEESSKPVLTPMITRSRIPYVLDARARWVTATWAAKTVFVFQSQMSGRLVPAVHPFLVKANGMPPAQVNIFIGSNDRARADPINSYFVVQPLYGEVVGRSPKEQVEFGYMAFIAIAGLSFLVLGHSQTGRLRFDLNPPSSELLTKLWPPEGDQVKWPPPMVMDRELLEIVFDQETQPPQLEMSLAEDEFPPRPRSRKASGDASGPASTSD